LQSERADRNPVFDSPTAALGPPLTAAVAIGAVLTSEPETLTYTRTDASDACCLLCEKEGETNRKLQKKIMNLQAQVEKLEDKNKELKNHLDVARA